MQSSQEGEIAGVAQILITIVFALVAGWLLVLWAVVKRPLLAVPAVLFVGLVVLVGGHDALALLLWALLGLGVWRLVHKRSFERMVGRRVRSVWVRWWVYGRRWNSGAGPEQMREGGVPEQLVQMAAAALRLAERRGLERLGRWVHMLGFRGHFVTKSRGYSTTLGELRQARADYRAEQDDQAADDEDETTPVIGFWTYVGSGYLNAGDVLLAAGVEASLRAAREALLDLRQRPPDR